MGITFLTVGGLLAPFQQFISWLGAVPSGRQASRRVARLAHPTQANRVNSHAHLSWPSTARAGQTASPLAGLRRGQRY